MRRPGALLLILANRTRSSSCGDNSRWRSKSISGALELCYSCVGSLLPANLLTVLNERAGLFKLFTTRIAHKALVFKMHTFVNDQSSLLAERLAAELARKLAILRVVFFVFYQLGDVRESHAARAPAKRTETDIN